jgi:hypothetical protein
MLTFHPNARNRCHRHYERQLQLQRRAGMQLAPKPEQRLRHPAPQTVGLMKPHMAADAKFDEQRLHVTAIAMMDHEPACRTTGATSETITLKDQLAQAAKPAQGVITAVIAEAAAAASL